MYARVARWEGAEADQIRATAQGINADAAGGPPEGLPAKGLMLLIDPDGGRSGDGQGAVARERSPPHVPLPVTRRLHPRSRPLYLWVVLRERRR